MATLIVGKSGQETTAHIRRAQPTRCKVSQFVSIRRSTSVLLTQYCAGDKIEKNEMGWACGAYGRGEGGV